MSEPAARAEKPPLIKMTVAPDGTTTTEVVDEGISDVSLAREVVNRLNALVADPGVRDFVGELLEQRVKVAESVLDHPTIQCDGELSEAGVLGLLNGLCGVRTDQWGYIAAVFSSTTGKLQRFEVLWDGACKASPASP